MQDNGAGEAMAQDAYRLDDQVGYILRLVSQRHAAIFQQHTVQGLTPTQLAALVRIHELGSCSQNQLGRRTAMDVATIKGVVDRLDKKGLVSLTADRGDRRRTVISLSEKGANLAVSLFEIGAAITQRTLLPLSASERRSFLRLLAKLT